VVELMDPNEEIFGITRLIEVIRENQHLSSNQVIGKVIDATQIYSAYNGLLDDLTLVIVRRMA
jgi:serine phosphatase RsbU (regulator of sigma subunit)